MMEAVWLVRSRQLLARFRFWLALFGYDRQDRSFLHKLYLVYAAVFFMVWGFAVLSLLAGQMGALLLLGGVRPLSVAATAVSLLGLLVWWFIGLYAASLQSPIVFSEEDAYLICQSPASRRAVALAWFAGQWPPSALFFGAAAVTIGFALFEAGAAGNLTGADLPLYVLAGLRSLSLILPVHVGLMATQWALGVYRLRGYQNDPGLRFIPIGLAVLLAAGLFVANSSAVPGAGFSANPGGLLVSLVDSPWMAVLWPVSFPLQAGYGLQPWLAGMLIALLFAGFGLLLLAWSATHLNLSRAAQESQARPGSGGMFLLRDARQAEELDQRNRLGVGRPPSRYSIMPGGGAILWKNLVRFSRTRLLPQLWTWSGIFGFCLAILLAPDWGVRAWAILVWALLVGQRSTAALQNDLALWSIFRQLPLSAERLILTEIIPPAIVVVLLAWGGLVFGAILHAPFASVWAVFLVPALVIDVALAAAFDVMRQCHSANLLVGYAPQPGIVALFISGGLVLSAILLAAWLSGIGLFLAAVLSLGSAGLLLRSAAGRLRRVR